MKNPFGKTVRILLVLVVVVAIVAVGAMLVRRKRKLLAKSPRYGVGPRPVHVAVARKGDLTETRDYLAVVEPIRLANVSARLTARVERVLHDEGDKVRAGDVLALLDDREIRQGMESIECQIRRAQADLAANEALTASLAKSSAYWDREASRDKTLADKGDIPPASAEATADKANEFKGRLDAARQKSNAIRHLIASLGKNKSQLETRLGYCTIRSPYNGLVTRRFVDPGDMAVPGKTLMVVEDRSRLKLAFDVPQQDLRDVHEGLPTTFKVASSVRRAKLAHMYPSLNLARMLRAEVYLAGPQKQGLSCGAYVPISVVLRRIRDATLVPASSLVECPKHQNHVFVVRNGKLEHPIVKVIGSGKDVVAVEGVSPGEQVVVNTFLGWANLAGGTKVEPIR